MAILPTVLTVLAATTLSVLLVVATFHDCRSSRIPNRATYSAFLAALVIAAAKSIACHCGVLDWDAGGAISLAESLKGAGLCFGLLMAVQLSSFGNQLGAGDIKLATAIGALLGWEQGLQTLIWCFLLPAPYIVFLAVRQYGLVRLGREAVLRLGSKLFPRWFIVDAVPGEFAPFFRQRVPLAAFFALGVLFTVLGV